MRKKRNVNYIEDLRNDILSLFGNLNNRFQILY